MTTIQAQTPQNARPAISMSKLAEEKDRAQAVHAPDSRVATVCGLSELHASITDRHQATANALAQSLAEKGFEGRHLDDMIYEIAQSICEKLRPSASNAHDLEYRLANELNTQPMNVQLAVMAVWFDDDLVLTEKLENDLMVRL